MFKKILILLFVFLPLNSFAFDKKTTFNEKLFKNAQLEGKVVVVSSWIKYCSSCASQMKVLNKAKKEFNNIEYFTFDVTNKEVSNFFNVEYQSTILIFKNNQEVYRSIGELSKDEIYRAINAVI